MNARAQIEVLREVFEEWLRIHDMDYDYQVYTQDEWRAHGETVIADAELVIAFENQLVSLMHYMGSWDVEDELQDLAAGFGYYFEFGHHWNIGFYPLDDWPELPPQNASYSDVLKDHRWTTKRNRIVRRADARCENCGRPSKRLEVHHCYYRLGRYAWQYPDAALLALCRDCHKSRATIELAWRGFMPRLKVREIGDLRKALDKCLYWFDRRRLFAFLTSLGEHDGACADRLKWLLETRGHPDERSEDAD